MPIDISNTTSECGRTFVHHWNVCVGAGRASEGLRASWLEQMKMVSAHCGFRYVRFHGLFHDDMFVYREVNGSVVYNFQYIDELFDRLLEIGVRPFVEFGFCPGDLASEKATVFWWKGHGSPPKDYVRWRELIQRFMRHVTTRYGLEEVRTWYFEVWNEPNLSPFFRGTKSQYFELYRTTVTAVKEIDEHLRVGGPATSNFVPDGRFDGEREDVSQHRVVTEAHDLDALDWKPVWLAQFLDFCVREKLPVDFVSVHPYPTDWALDEHGTGMKLTRGVDATPKDLALLRRMIDESAFPKAEIHLTEWSSSSSPRDFTHDYLQAATYVVKANVESIGSVDSLAYWTFTDVFEEGGAGDTAFHGGFGLINYQGIVKPSFHAYRFLALLGDQLIAQEKGAIITRSQATGKFSALAYNYPPEVLQTVPGSFGSRAQAEDTLALGRAEKLRIVFAGLRPGTSVVVETLTDDAGDAMSAWKSLGSPEPLSREQTDWLRSAAFATRKESLVVAITGEIIVECEIEPWSLVSVREL